MIPFATFVLTFLFYSLLTDAAIDWSLVPDIPPLARNLHLSSLGNCKCNIYSAVCDRECCCDPDCDDKDKELYRQNLKCEDTTEVVQTRFCRDNSLLEIFKVNHRDVIRFPGRELACIVYNNHPDRKDYIEIPTTVNFGSAGSTKRHHDWYSIKTPTTDGFQPGDYIPLHTIDTSTSPAELHASPAPDTFLGIPTRGNNGICGQLVSVPFMSTTHPISCYKQGPTPPKLCSALSYPYLQAILTPNTPISSMSDVKPFIIKVIDAKTLKEIGSFDPTPIFASAFTSVPSTDVIPDKIKTRYDTSTETCTNAVVGLLREIEYDSIVHQGFASVTRNTATLFITDISMKQFTPRKTVIYQESIVFLREGSKEAKLPLEHTFTPRRSARAGYVTGSPVLAGTFSTNGAQEAINQHRGLSFPMRGCLEPYNSVTVKFWNNLDFVACYVKLNEAELRGLCASPEGTSQLLKKILNNTHSSLGITAPSAGIVDRIGMTMDASYMVPSSWVPVNGISWSTVKPYPYDTMQRSCENIITGLNYQIVVGAAGSPVNPQDVIIGAEVVPTYGTWTFRGRDKSEQRKFRFRFSVKFVRNVEKRTIRNTRIEPPAILPAIDEDVFYPFRLPRL